MFCFFIAYDLFDLFNLLYQLYILIFNNQANIYASLGLISFNLVDIPMWFLERKKNESEVVNTSVGHSVN